MADAETDEANEYPLGPALGLLREWWALNHAFERTSRRMASRLGVTAPQRMVLRVIGRYPGIGPGKLAEVLHLDAGTISATVRRLEESGVVKRRQTSRDRRRVALGLTAQGRELDGADEQTIEGALARVIESVPPEHVAVVRSFLASFVRELEHVASADGSSETP
jgi:MarR family transcriptional regulator, organic hydroperoxide resistance regulator